jgi:hypothetical protein
LRRALPRVVPTLSIEPFADGLERVTVTFENHGYLSTAALDRAKTIGTAPPVTARLVRGEAIEGLLEQSVGWLEGWGSMQAADAAQPLYPSLPDDTGVRHHVRWIVLAGAPLRIVWDAGRGGSGAFER